MSKNRIAICSVFHPFRGGIAQFSDNLLQEMRRYHAIEVINYKRQYPKFLFPGKSQYVEGVTSFRPSIGIDSIGPMSWWRVARYLKTRETSVVITAYWMSLFAPALGTFHRLLGKKVVKIALIHNVVPHEARWFDTLLNRYFLNSCDAAVVLSKQVQEDVKALHPTLPLIRLQHPPYQQFGKRLARKEALQHLQLSDDKTYLLFFGLIRSYKGLDNLIEALVQLPDDVHLLVAGECYGDLDTYKSLVRKHDLLSRVHWFTQYIADEEVKYFFSAADRLVLPYKEATQSGVSGIAHVFQLPIVATPVGGLPEQLNEASEDVLCTGPNADALAEGVARSLTMKNHHRLFTAATWESFSTSLCSFIEQHAKN